MLRYFSVPVFCVVLTLMAFPARADTVTLRNGDRLTGEVQSLKDGTLRLKTGYAGTVKLPFADVVGLSTDGVVTLRYVAGGYSSGRLAGAGQGSVRIVGAGNGNGAIVNLGTIAEIYPGTQIPRGFQWEGRINVGANARSGNTDTRSVHIDTAIKGRTDKNRLRFEGSYNKEFDGSQRTVDDYTVFVQHDRFVSKALYFYTNVKLQRDKPQDLILRTTVGTGGGWQIFETDRTNLSVEVGPSYAREDHAAGEDRGFVAGRWAVNADHYVWDKYVQFFHSHEGTIDLENTGNVFIDSSTGFRFPIRNSFNMTAQLDLDWDSDPEPGISSLDKTYLLTVGYNW